jgi:Helix-turn-helix
MIKTEQEYRRCLEQLRRHEELLEHQRQELEEMGLTREEVERGLASARMFQLRMWKEIEEYERIKAGNFDMACSFERIGRHLIALRIHKGITREELARRLGVQVERVIRDERSEYGGAGLKKIRRVLRALGVRMVLATGEGKKASGT